jgi:hypothetical protein
MGTSSTIKGNNINQGERNLFTRFTRGKHKNSSISTIKNYYFKKNRKNGSIFLRKHSTLKIVRGKFY